MLENKRLVSNTLFLSIRLIIVIFVSFYASRVLLKALGISDFGVYNVVGSVVAMFSSLRGLFSSSVQRFLNFEMGRNDQRELNRCFSMSITIHVIICIVFFILAEIIGLWMLTHTLVVPADRVVAAHIVYQLSVLSAIVLIMSVPYDAVIIAHEKMNVFAYISIIDSLLKLFIVICLSWVGGDKLIVYAILLFVVTIIVRLLSVMYCRLKYREFRYYFFWDRQLFKRMGSFAGWNFLGSSSYNLMHAGLNVLLNVFGGTAVNAARGIALQVTSASSQFINNLQTAANPQIVKSVARGENDNMFGKVFMISRLSFFLTILACVPMFCFAESILILWLGECPEHVVSFIQILLLSLIFRSLHGPIDSMFKAVGSLKYYQIVDASTLVLSLPLSYVLLRCGYSVESAFMTLVFAEGLNICSILFVAKRTLHFDIRHYVLHVVLPCLYVSLFLSPMIYLLWHNQHQTIYIQIGWLFIWALCVSVAIFFLGISKKERKRFIRHMVKRSGE